MTDFFLGRARGEVDIDYDDSGAQRMIVDLDKAADSSDNLEKSLSKTQRTLKDTEGEFDKAGSSADSYTRRLRDVDSAHTSLHGSHQRSTSDTQRFSEVTQDAEKSADHFKEALHGLTLVASLFGPEARAGALAVEKLGSGFGDVGEKAAKANESVRNFIKDIGQFEASFAKIAGLTLSVPSLGGLAGIGGAAGVQGIVEVADAVRQLSGALGLLPAAAAGVGVVMGTLKVAFHGVGDALKDMMADDPKKFLQDIANMGPAAAHSMLQIAQFRDQFKLAGGAIQDSFFKQIANDIAPLIQTLLPALTKAGSQIATIMGQGADQFAKLLMQPQMLQSFAIFIDNISDGLRAMQPAMAPILDTFTRLSVVGSSFFGQIGGVISRVADEFDKFIAHAQQTGQLQAWIQTGINAFEHLGNIMLNVGEAFNRIMTVADQFGGGGLLGFLDKVSGELNAWTQSAEGQKALTDFFATLRQATDAFLPILKPLLDGLVSIGSAFTHLGIDTAPAWLDVFKTFAYEMANDLGPAIQGMGPAVNTFLEGLTDTFRKLSQTLGPKLPQIFEDLANAFVQILPQIPQLAADFADLLEKVGPQLPSLFAAVTDAINQITPLMPQIIHLFREFVSAITILVQVIGGLVEGGAKLVAFIEDLPDKLGKIGETIAGFFVRLPEQAAQWGSDLLKGFISGLNIEIGGVEDWLQRNITDHIPQIVKDALGIHSPSTVFHEIGVNLMAGLAQGLAAGAPAVMAQTSAIAGQVTGSMRGGLGSGGALAGSGGAPAPGGADALGGALLPDNIAGADTSILDRYLQHQFDDNRGLKGLAKDLGNMLSAFQSGFNLISQHVISPLTQVMGMIPGLNQQRWVKMSPQEFADQQQQEMQRRAIENAKNPTWTQVLGGQPGGQPGDQATHMTTPGGTALADALKAKGFSPQQIRLILAFSQVEGNNPAGNPTLGFTDSQLGGATDLQSHVDALAKQFIDRASVAGKFPEGGTDLQQAQWIAKVVGQAGLSSDWQGNAQPQDYVQRIVRAMGLLPGAANPSWQQITGGGLSTPGAPPIALPPGTAAAHLGAPGYTSDAALLANVPAGRYLQTQAADLLKGIGDCSSAVEDLINMMDGVSTAGRQMSTANAAQWLTAHGFLPTNTPVPGAFNVGFNSEHMQATLPGGTPFNWGTDAAAAARGIGGTGAFDPAFTQHFYRPASGWLPGAAPGGATPSTGYPDVDNALKALNDTQNKQLTVNDRLLQAYLQGNPALADQINAAKTPGASDQQVLAALNGISTTITGLKTQDAIGNKNTIDALQSAQSQIAQQQGFTQAPSIASTISQVASGASNIASSVIQTIQSTLQAMSSTQDIADRLVYGIRNTEDINKVIDDVQSYITLASNIAGTVGQVLSTIGGIVGAGGSSDPSGGSQGASMALSAAGQIAQLISGALQGVNAAIDFGQQIYHIAGTYVGRALSVLTAGLGGTPLMGNVRFLLNKNTGQLITYSEDNPQNQNALTVPSWLNQTYDYGGGRNPNPGIGSLTIYAGPGASAAQLFNHANWAAATAGTSGAMAANNF
ncbi:phage tail protein [Mycobacterium malmoense]|uniref:phage tail protein n=1 Tax=Mycobacterium malmoense TaxID=1780 RepID=UPI0008F8B3CF|nr:hypothetical protein [Mycobacterium malmoense]OIN79350.1 hypothetical protein BMG05_18360 [Mycobacterium malmoense]